MNHYEQQHPYVYNSVTVKNKNGSGCACGCLVLIALAAAFVGFIVLLNVAALAV